MLIEGLEFGFGKRTLFSDVNMQFEKGKVIGIVGKNGVGKTSFFRVIKGIYKSHHGYVSLDGEKLLNEKIGFLPTHPYFYPFMKGKEYLSLVLQKHSHHLTDILELPLDELVDNYSTGMKKKLAFSGVMGLNNPVVILDEPFNGVDLQSNAILKQIIRKNAENRVTLISSHILEIMTDLCDGIYFIEDGFQYKYYESDSFVSLIQDVRNNVASKLKDYSNHETGPATG